VKYRHLGKAGIQVSELSFGSWVTFHTQAGVDSTVEMMSAAYDAGVNFFDNAEVYAAGKSEEVMGAALKRLGWRRGSYLISTKLFWGLHEGPNEQNTLNRKYLLEAIDGSLLRLGTDYVDLLFCHRPDPSTPIEETVWAMHNIIEPIYNLFERHRFAPDYKVVYEDHRIGSTTWSPLASGLLTGKYKSGIPSDSRGALEGYGWLREQLTDESQLAKVSALEPIADAMGATLAQFAIAWCLQNPYVSTVMTGASRVSQVHENMKAMEFTDKFTPDVMREIDRVISSP